MGLKSREEKAPYSTPHPEPEGPCSSVGSWVQDPGHLRKGIFSTGSDNRDHGENHRGQVPEYT